MSPEASNTSRDGHPALSFVRENLLLILLALTLLTILALILIEPLRINHDNAVFLEIGGRILDGQLPYVDFFDMNFLFITYLNLPVVALARLINSNPIPVYLLTVWVLIVWSSLTTRHLLTKLYPHNPRIPTTLALAIALFSLFLFARDFGQREHLFTLLFFPGFTLRWLRQEVTIKRWHALLLGVAAGAAVCIKPHFILIPLLPELYWLMRNRRLSNLFRPEVYGLVGVGILYLLSFLILPTASRDGFFNDMLPSLLRDYDAYSRPYAWYEDQRTWHVLILVSVMLFLSARRDGDIWGWLRPLALATLGAWLAWIIQGKFWDYQYIAAQFMALITLSVLITGVKLPGGSAIEKRGFQAFHNAVFTGTVLIVVLQTIIFGFLTSDYGKPSNSEMRQWLLENSDVGDPVMVLSTSVFPAYPLLLQHERQNINPYIMAHPIAFNLKNLNSASEVFQNDAPIPAEIEEYLRDIEQVIKQERPVLLFVDARSTCQACPFGMSVDEYLRFTGFTETVIDPSYTLVKQGRYDRNNIFDFYVRNTAE